MIIDKEFMGLDQMVWAVGIVEDVQDPMELGRCKVRWFGFYGPASKAPTATLPWATPIMPCISASHEGHGWSPTGLEPNSWVIGFFLDGRRAQFPVIWGSFHGVQATKNLPPGYGVEGSGSGAGQGGPGGGPGGTGGTGGGPGVNMSDPRLGEYYNYIISKGYSPGVAAATVSTMAAESRGLDPSATWNDVGQTSGGLFSYRAGRLDAMFAAADSDAYKQIDYFLNDQVNNFGLNPQADVGSAMSTMNQSQHFVGWDSNTSRLNAAQDFMDKQGATPAATTPEETRTETPPAQQGSMDNTDNAGPTKTEELQQQQEDQRVGAKVAGNKSTWWTPTTPDQNKYPKSQVWQSQDGSSKIMMDATPNATGMKIYHKSGTVIWVDDGGNMTVQAQGSKSEAVKGNSRVLAFGDHNITSGGNLHTLAGREMIMEATGAISHKAGTSFSVSSDGHISFHTSGDLTFNASSIKLAATSGSIDMKSPEHINMEAAQELNMSAGVSQDPAGAGTGINIDTPGAINFNTADTLRINADVKMEVEPPDYSLKGPALKFDKMTVDELYVSAGMFEELNWAATNSTAKKSMITATMGPAFVPGTTKTPQNKQPLRSAKLGMQQESGSGGGGMAKKYGATGGGAGGGRGMSLPLSTLPPKYDVSEQSPASIARTATANPAAKKAPGQGVVGIPGSDLASAPASSSADGGPDTPSSTA